MYIYIYITHHISSNRAHTPFFVEKKREKQHLSLENTNKKLVIRYVGPLFTIFSNHTKTKPFHAQCTL